MGPGRRIPLLGHSESPLPIYVSLDSLLSDWSVSSAHAPPWKPSPKAAILLPSLMLRLPYSEQNGKKKNSTLQQSPREIATELRFGCQAFSLESDGPLASSAKSIFL